LRAQSLHALVVLLTLPTSKHARIISGGHQRSVVPRFVGGVTTRPTFAWQNHRELHYFNRKCEDVVINLSKMTRRGFCDGEQTHHEIYERQTNNQNKIKSTQINKKMKNGIEIISGSGKSTGELFYIDNNY